jgi:LytR cell envelope-related transcriptional attenuator
LPLDILQEVGSYAGLAAIIGLAVLSALYFSQARDVKRLREWAGRAPERSAEEAAQAAAAPAPSGGVVAQPQPKGAPKPGVARPAPAQAAAAGAAPASAVAAGNPQGAAPAAATPAGEATQAGEDAPQAAPPGEDEKEAVVAAAGGDRDREGAEREAAEGVPAEREEDAADRERVGAEREQVAAAAPQPAVAAAGAQSAAARRQEGAAAPGARQGETQDQEPLVPPQAAPVPQATAAAGAGTQAPEAPRPGTRAGTQTPPRPRPASGSQAAPPSRTTPRSPSVPAGGAARPPGRPGSARQAQTAIIPPPSRARWSSRVLASPRYLVLVIAGLLIVGGGALFGLSQLASEDGGTGSRSASGGGAAQEDSGGGQDRRTRPIVPAEVTVAVLNGTTVPGLAAQIGDRLETLDFDVGTVTNSTDQERAESVVLFAPGRQREAAAVGRRLGIGQRERADPESQGLAGDASVIVIAGIDQTQ